jgi:hypothetical protein
MERRDLSRVPLLTAALAALLEVILSMISSILLS